MSIQCSQLTSVSSELDDHGWFSGRSRCPILNGLTGFASGGPRGFGDHRVMRHLMRIPLRRDDRICIRTTLHQHSTAPLRSATLRYGVISTDTYTKLLRSESPLQFWSVVNSLKMDNPPRVGVDGYLRRCLPEKDTAALSRFCVAAAGDATAASLSDGELRAVKSTSELSRRAVSCRGDLPAHICCAA